MVKTAHVQTPPPDPRTLRPDLPAWVAAAILAALEKEPEKRPKTCEEFLARLRGGAEARQVVVAVPRGEEEAEPAGDGGVERQAASQHAGRGSRRRLGLVLLVIGIVVGGIGVGIVMKSRFVDNGDGTVTDRKTGLVWSRGDLGRMGWNDALEFCRENKAGLPGSGWRLPTIDELRTLIVECPATDPGGRCPAREGCKSREDCFGTDWLQNCAPCDLWKGLGPSGCYMDGVFEEPCRWYWSSTPVPWSSSSAFNVYFHNGHVNNDGIGNSGGGVRCVRAGQ